MWRASHVQLSAVQQVNSDLRARVLLWKRYTSTALFSRLLLQNSLIRRIDGEVEVGLFGDGQRINHILLSIVGARGQRVRLGW